MYFWNRRFLGALTFVLLGSVAAAETLVCSVEGVSQSGWFPSQLSVEFAEDRKAAQVQASVGSVFMPVTLVRRSDNSYLLDWNAERAFVAQQAVASRDRYRLLVNFEKMKVSLQILPEVVTAEISLWGFGTCAAEAVQAEK
ncbi:hypothetical protein [Pseudophaeobacter sp.]|uniref:hypothetical protein n=1 Tax=Pseudophaeobacter sp. TaxID=1971739 RepID=UPI003296A769